MPSSDLIEPTRLERLLGGAAPESEREAVLQGLVRELRVDTRPAPTELRDRIRALEAPKRVRPPLVRRTALAFAAVALLAAAGLAATLALREPEEAAVKKPAATTVSEGVEPPSSPGPNEESGGLQVPWAPAANTGEALKEATRAHTAQGTRLSGDLAAKLPFPGDTRAQDVDMSIELRVADADELSDVTNEAMRATRTLGGLIVSSSVDTGGKEGLARLDLRIPVRRLEDAVLRFSALGKITSQQVATRDLQGPIDRRAGQIVSLQRAVERDKLILASGTLSPEERLEVQLRIARERARLQDLRRERARLIREAAMVDLSLTLHTRAAPKRDADEGGVAGAARQAFDFLGGAGAVAVFALVILSPLLVLGAILWAFLRSRRRRLDDRLLEQPRPHAPPS
jgi:hypothetical protein